MFPTAFFLAKALATATRESHRPGARIQDTVNEILMRFARAWPIASAEPVEESNGSAGGSQKTTSELEFGCSDGTRTDTGLCKSWTADRPFANERIAEYRTLMLKGGRLAVLNLNFDCRLYAICDRTGLMSPVTVGW